MLSMIEGPFLKIIIIFKLLELHCEAPKKLRKNRVINYTGGEVVNAED